MGATTATTINVAANAAAKGRRRLQRAARTKGPTGRALPWVGLVFAGIGAVVFWFVGVVPLSGVHAAQSWTPQTCTIASSRVESHRSDDGTTWTTSSECADPCDLYGEADTCPVDMRFAKLAAGRHHTCGIDDGGDLWC